MTSSVDSVDDEEIPYFEAPPVLEQIGDLFELFGLYLAKPIQYVSEPFLRAVCTVIRPGEDGNFQSATLEKIWRIFIVTLSVVTAPITLGLALLGGGMDLIAGCIKQKPYTYFKGNAPPNTQPKDELRILTLNACMFWGGLPIPLGGAGPSRERIEELAQLIKAQNPDIIVMQEVAFGPSIDLYHQLKDEYAHFFTRIGPNPFRMESGLFIASKEPVISQGWIPFPNQNGIFRGAFYVETPSSYIFTTHLEYGNTKEAQDMRNQQLKLIQQQMSKFEKRKPCFLLGDLNMNPQEASQLSGEYFNPAPETATCTNALMTYRCGKPQTEPSEEIVDYTLIKKENAQDLELQVSCIDTYSLQALQKALSDHKVLLLQIKNLLNHFHP